MGLTFISYFEIPFQIWPFLRLTPLDHAKIMSILLHLPVLNKHAIISVPGHHVVAVVFDSLTSPQGWMTADPEQQMQGQERHGWLHANKTETEKLQAT